MISEGPPSTGRQMSPAPAEGILPPTTTKQAAWLDEGSALCHSQQLTAHASVTATKEPRPRKHLPAASLALLVKLFARPVLKVYARARAGSTGRGDHPWPATAQCVADARIQSLKRHAGVLLTGQHDERMDILLRTAIGPLRRALCDKDNRSQVRGLAIFVRVHRRRQKRRIRIAGFISGSWSGGTDMWGNALRYHGNPFTPRMVISILREFEPPKRRVNAHSIFVTPPAITHAPRAGPER